MPYNMEIIDYCDVTSPYLWLYSQSDGIYELGCASKKRTCRKRLHRCGILKNYAVFIGPSCSCLQFKTFKWRESRLHGLDIRPTSDVCHRLRWRHKRWRHRTGCRSQHCACAGRWRWRREILRRCRRWEIPRRRSSSRGDAARRWDPDVDYPCPAVWRHGCLRPTAARALYCCATSSACFGTRSSPIRHATLSCVILRSEVKVQLAASFEVASTTLAKSWADREF